MKAHINGITFDGSPDEIMAFLAKYSGETDAQKKVAPAPDTLTGELFAVEMKTGGVSPEAEKKQRDYYARAAKGELTEDEKKAIEDLKKEIDADIDKNFPPKRQRRRIGCVVCYHRSARGEQPIKFYHRLGHLLAEYGIDDSYTGAAAALRVAKIANGRDTVKPVQSVTMWSADGFAECWMFDREGRYVYDTVTKVQPAEIIEDKAEAGNADAE